MFILHQSRFISIKSKLNNHNISDSIVAYHADTRPVSEILSLNKFELIGMNLLWRK